MENLKELLIQASTGVLALMTIIQISPIKINPWTWLARLIGKALNGEVIEQLNRVEKDLSDHLRSEESCKMENARRRIFRFNDELMRDVRHSQEHFKDVLRDIDAYENYCDTHKDFRNSFATLSIENIRRVYEKVLRDKDFL